MAGTTESLEELVRLVKSSAKYAAISADLVREIGQKELDKRRSLKEAVKETRNKLHQVGSAYQEKPIPYTAWTEKLNQLPANLSDPQVRDFLQACMKQHASTAERLAILPRFYDEIFTGLAPVRSILDLACGLNPLALPWLPVGTDIEYLACDIYEDMTAFLDGFFRHFQVKGSAFPCDLTQTLPQNEVSLALLLKTVPCLDQVDKSAASRLLHALRAEHILVSFPGHSLSGKGKGMKTNYEARFNELVEGENWQVTRFDFPGELAFLIRK
jgi:16S rRNA (guanine(1405)-N(7))-methyltransferase